MHTSQSCSRTLVKCHQSPPKYGSNPTFATFQVYSKFPGSVLAPLILSSICQMWFVYDLVLFLKSKSVKLFSVSYLIVFYTLSVVTVVEVSSCNTLQCWCNIACCFKFKLLWPLINKTSNDSVLMGSWEGQPQSELALCWVSSCPVNRQWDLLQRFHFTLVPLRARWEKPNTLESLLDAIKTWPE